MADILPSFTEEIPVYKSDVGFETFTVSIYGLEETLAKVDDYPTHEGQWHSTEPRIAKMHTSGKLMWHVSPDMARKHDQHLNNPELRQNFLKNIPSLKHRKAMEAVMNRVAKDPNRHFIPTEENGRPTLRARHMKSLLLGTHDITLDISDPNQLVIHRDSHSRGRNIGSTIPHVFNIVEKKPNVQKTERHDEGGAYRDSEDRGFARRFRHSSGSGRSSENSGAGSSEVNWVGRDDRDRLEKSLKNNRQIATHWMTAAYGDANPDDVAHYTRSLGRMGHKHWKLISVPVENISGHHEGHDASKEYIEDYAEQAKSGSPFPPLILEPHPGDASKFQTIDGQHRLEAAKTIGHTHINAYVPISLKKSERLEKSWKHSTWQDSYLKHKNMDIAPQSSTHWHPLVRLQHDLLNQGKLMYHPKQGYTHNRKIIDRGDGTPLMKSDDHGYCTMFIFEGIEKPDILHVTHKYFGKGFKDEKDIVKVLEKYFKENPFKSFTETFDKEEFFGEEKDVRVLRAKSNEKFLPELKERLEEIIKDKWPEYKPHVSVSSNVDEVNYPIVDYALVKGGKVLWSATGKLYKSEDDLLFKNEGNTKLIHYGRVPGLKTLEPTFQGTGYPDASMKRRGKPENPVTYFYREGQYVEPDVESSAKSKYHVTLTPDKRLYDIGQDPESVVDSTLKENNGAWNPDLIEGKIKSAGYHGYFNSKGSLPSAVALFHPQSVDKEEVLRHG